MCYVRTVVYNGVANYVLLMRPIQNKKKQKVLGKNAKIY